MYFDFEDRHPETPTIDTAMSRREALVLSVAVHIVLIAFVSFAPNWQWVQALNEQSEAAVAAQMARLEAEQAPQAEPPRFVFVQPRIDTPAPAPPPRAELSDVDREARTVERAPSPTNSLPFARGNSTERVEASPEMRARGEGPQPEPSEPGSSAAERGDAARASNTSGAGFAVPAPAEARTAKSGRPGAGGGNLGDALRNLQQYVQNQSFDNPGGGDGTFGPAIQFDTKGVEFGPWVRRFIAQVKRNWFIPYAAMSMHGHVVITFNVHRDGRISELRVVKPAGVQAFDNAAFNALASSNPTQPLPREYPDDHAFFTVTFYYNEAVPTQ